MEQKQTLKSVFFNGLITENPTFRLVLGTCPTMAVTTNATNGIGMGAAATFVLVGSNIVISMLRNFIPDKIRIPAFIIVICTFVTMDFFEVCALCSIRAILWKIFQMHGVEGIWRGCLAWLTAASQLVAGFSAHDIAAVVRASPRCINCGYPPVLGESTMRSM